MSKASLSKSVKTKPAKKAKRQYDLPIIKDDLARFQFSLTCVMSVLCIWLITGFFVAEDVSTKWMHSLSGKITVQIPTINDNGDKISEVTISNNISNLKQILNASSEVSDIRLVDNQRIQKLISPWLGDLAYSENIPAPKILTATLKDASPDLIDKLETNITKALPGITVQNYKNWFADLFKLLETSKFIASIAVLILISIILISIYFAVKARMALLKDDIEILHLMGASEDYISKQFEKQSAITCLKSSFLGLLIGFLSASIIVSIALSSQFGHIDNPFSLTSYKIMLYILFPLALTLLSSATAKLTARKILLDLP